MSNSVESVGLFPSRSSAEPVPGTVKVRDKSTVETKHEDQTPPPQSPPAKVDPPLGLNQSSAAYKISLDPGTLRTITEVVDRESGEVLFSIPTGYRSEQSGGGVQSTGGGQR
jgi:hypothetical protein